MTKNQLKTNVINFINELEMIFSDIREKNVDDSVCGLCEYDCDHGLDGYANECPGFERDDCFKLKEEYRNEWINKIIGEEYGLTDADTDKYAVQIQNGEGYYNSDGKYVSYDLD